MLRLADRWGVSIGAIEEMPVDQFIEWQVYFQRLDREKPKS